jgi:FixJ family two-component response regulator
MILHLSDQELSIDGLSTAVIAQQLSVSPRTIDFHRSALKPAMFESILQQRFNFFYKLFLNIENGSRSRNSYV